MIIFFSLCVRKPLEHVVVTRRLGYRVHFVDKDGRFLTKRLFKHAWFTKIIKETQDVCDEEFDDLAPRG